MHLQNSEYADVQVQNYCLDYYLQLLSWLLATTTTLLIKYKTGSVVNPFMTDWMFHTYDT